MLVNYNNKYYIILHPKKTAGSSIKVLFSKYNIPYKLLNEEYDHIDRFYNHTFGHHITCNYISSHIKEKINVIFPIRDPIKRIYSYIKYCVKRCDEFNYKVDHLNVENIEQFCKVYNRASMIHQYEIFWYYKLNKLDELIQKTNLWKIEPQITYIKKNMKIDYLVRTENIDNDIKLISNDLIVEEKNKSNYGINLNEKSIELIKNYYKDDYDFFEFDTDNYNLNTIEYLNFINSKLME